MRQKVTAGHVAVIGLTALMVGGALALFFPAARSAGAATFALACIGILLLRRLLPELFELRERIELDAQGVRRMVGPRQTESLTWSELVRVSITTTAAGPLAEDFFFLLHAVDGHGVAVPNKLAVDCGLLERLQCLPGFDNEAVVAASGSVEDDSFLCWEGTPGQGTVAAPQR